MTFYTFGSWINAPDAWETVGESNGVPDVPNCANRPGDIEKSRAGQIVVFEDSVECMSCLANGIGTVFIFDTLGGIYQRDMCYVGIKAVLDCLSDPFCIDSIG